MKNTITAALLLLASFTAHAEFLDMMAAPNGAPLSIYGDNVDGPIVVNGQVMTNCPTINETVYEVTETGRRLAKTTCWLAGVPEGPAIVSAGDSEPLDFVLNTGTVHVVESFAAFKAEMKNPKPGDVFLLKGFTTNLTTDGKANGGKASLWMRSGEHNGTEAMPIALIGYPGDPATFQTDSYHVNYNKSFQIQSKWWIIANISLDNGWNGGAFYDTTRIVGNRFNSMKQFPKGGQGFGSVILGGGKNGGHFLGNTVYGARSGWRFDHAIYLSGCPNETGWMVGHNYIYDNDFGRGPQLVVNHQVPRCGSPPATKTLAQQTIYQNTIDTSTARGRCIGQNGLGWYPDEDPVAPEPTIIDGNDLIGCGYSGDELDHYGDRRRGGALTISRSGALITNNRLYRCDGCIGFGMAGSESNAFKQFQDTLVEANQVDSVNGGTGIGAPEHLLPKLTIKNNILGLIE